MVMSTKKGKSCSCGLDKKMHINNKRLTFPLALNNCLIYSKGLTCSINQCIKMKQNRCQESELIKDYKVCDELMSEISNLLLEKQLIETCFCTEKERKKIQVVL